MEEGFGLRHLPLKLVYVYFGGVDGVPLQGVVDGEDEGVAVWRIGHSLAQAEQGLAQVTPPVRVGAIRPEQGGNVGAGLGDALFEDKVGDKGGDALGGEGKRFVI